MGVMRPDLVMRCVIPVVMAGIIAIYGLIVAVMIAGDIAQGMTLSKYLPTVNRGGNRRLIISVKLVPLFISVLVYRLVCLV